MFELQQLSSGRYGTSGASSLPLASVYTSRRVSGESGSGKFVYSNPCHS